MKTDKQMKNKLKNISRILLLIIRYVIISSIIAIVFYAIAYLLG